MASPSEVALRRRRSLRTLVVLLVLGAVASVILVFRQAMRGPSDPEGFLEDVVEEGENVALVGYSITAEGVPDPADPVVLHNADVMMPLAGLSRVPLLLAYAQAVAAGEAKQDEPVSVRTWERDYLPGTDGGAHAKALKAAGVAAGTGGFAVSPDATVKLDQVVAAMIEYGDHAAGDYLLERLTEARVNAAIKAAGMAPHDPFLPTSGLFLVAAGLKDEADARALLDKGPSALAAAVHAAVARFHTEIAGKPEHAIWMERYPTPGGSVQALWSDRAMPRGTARSYATVLARVAAGKWATPEEAAVVARHLSWPMRLEGNAGLLSAFAGKGGTLSSVITEAFYVTPKQGDFAGKTRIVVLLQRRMSGMRWLATVRSFIHQHFMLKFATERAFAQASAEALGGAIKR